jgi:ADP-ribose pyrophosphatase
MAELSSKTVYQAKYFHITQKQIERNGKTFTKDFIERNPSVLVLPINDQEEFYLESQFRDAFGKTLLEVVSGNMEHEGNPLETAKRELLEEAGLTAAIWEQIAKWELSVNMNAPLYIFAAKGITEGKQQLDNDEVIDIIKMPFEEAVQKAVSGEILASAHIAAILLYDKLKNEGKV